MDQGYGSRLWIMQYIKSQELFTESQKLFIESQELFTALYWYWGLFISKLLGLFIKHHRVRPKQSPNHVSTIIVRLWVLGQCLKLPHLRCLRCLRCLHCLAAAAAAATAAAAAATTSDLPPRSCCYCCRFCCCSFPAPAAGAGSLPPCASGSWRPATSWLATSNIASAPWRLVRPVLVPQGASSSSSGPMITPPSVAALPGKCRTRLD